jgi:membrane-associated protease RseP (regulator of RpoE activity)
MNGSNFVTSVTKGGAAESAGIKVGDEIQAIDGLNVLKGYPATEMIRRLNGGEGTSATVNVMHRDGIKDGPKATIKLLRKKALAAKDYEASVKDGVAVLVIRAFNPTVVSGIKTWMSSAEVKNAKGIILDVRSNPSGDMNSLLAVFSNFLPKGTQLGTLLGASKSLPLATAGNKTLQKQKVAVLLNYTGLFSYIVRYAFYIKMQPAAVMIADQASTFTQSSITFGGLMDTPLQYCAEPATFTWDLVSKGDIQVLGAYGTDGAMDRAKQEVLK